MFERFLAVLQIFVEDRIHDRTKERDRLRQ